MFLSSLSRFFLAICLLLLLDPLRASGETAWFLKTPSGGSLPGEEELHPPEDGPWDIAEELDLIARPGQPLPSCVDLEHYQMVGRTGPFRLQVGQQSASEGNLILNDLRRRGFSLRVQGGPRKGALKGFLLQGRPKEDREDVLGLSDGNNRIGAVVGEITPISGGPVNMRFSAGYLTGRRPGWIPEDPQRGEAWTAIAEAGLWNRLQLRGEVAGSRFLPAEDWGEVEEGQALALKARYQSTYRPQNALPLEWYLGMETQQIDPLFYSLGHPGLGADRERIKLFAGGRQDRLGLNASLARERNNLENFPQIPTVERYDYVLQLQYDLNRPTRRAPWLGNPRYTLIVDGFRRRALKSPEGPSDPSPVKDGERRMQCRIDFDRQGWAWGAGYRVSDYEDFADPLDDSRQRALDLRLEARLGDRLSLYPAAEFGTTVTDREEIETARLGLRGKAVLIPEWLKAGWDLSLSREGLPGGGLERNTVLGGDLTCTLRPPREGRPGYDLSLSGSRRERQDRDRPWRENLDYRLYLSLTMILPPLPL